MSLDAPPETGRAARWGLRLFPPDRWLFRPDPAGLGVIRHALEIDDRPPTPGSPRPPGGPTPSTVDLAAWSLSARRQLQQAGGGALPPDLATASRRQSLRTRRLFKATLEALRPLHAAGIPVMALKGVPLVLTVYRDLSLRPMADVDLLIPPDRLDEALALLAREGLLPVQPPPAGLARSPGHVDHSVPLRRPGGPEIDLHYYALDECRWPGADQGLWARAEERPFLGLPLRVPGPTDMLLHLCAHGYRVQGSNPRWVLDAGLLLLHGPALDWALLVEETLRRRLVLPLVATLSYLQGPAGLTLPRGAAEALDRLRAAPLEWWEPLDFRLRAGASLRGRTRRLFLAALDHLRLAAGERRSFSWSGLRDYLCLRWGQPGTQALAGEIARRALSTALGRPPGELPSQGPRPLKSRPARRGPAEGPSTPCRG